MKYELALIDARIVPEVSDSLMEHVHHILPFKTEGITYNSISCHPDIFIHQSGKRLIVAPNMPQSYKTMLKALDLELTEGQLQVGTSLEDSTLYNCISGHDYLLHKKGSTAPEISALHPERHRIYLPQAYSRCSMLALKKGVAITSDRGIEKTLLKEGWSVYYFSPKAIRIPDHAHGFLGGCCGVFGTRVYTLGNALRHEDGRGLKRFVQEHGYDLCPLSDKPLYDGGGVFLF